MTKDKVGSYIDENGYEREEPVHSNLIHRKKAYTQIYLKNRDRYKLPFSEYVIHHIDGNKRNNKISNLMIMLPEEHEKLHGFAKDEFDEELDSLDYSDDFVQNMKKEEFEFKFHKILDLAKNKIKDSDQLLTIFITLYNDYHQTDYTRKIKKFYKEFEENKNPLFTMLNYIKRHQKDPFNIWVKQKKEKEELEVNKRTKAESEIRKRNSAWVFLGILFILLLVFYILRLPILGSILTVLFVTLLIGLTREKKLGENYLLFFNDLKQILLISSMIIFILFLLSLASSFSTKVILTFIISSGLFFIVSWMIPKKNNF